jgi:hypothetical protein
MTMWFKSDIRHLLISNMIASGATGMATYLLLPGSTIVYEEHNGSSWFRRGAHCRALLCGNDVSCAAGHGSAGRSNSDVRGAITCRAIIRKKRPAGRYLRNTAPGVIGVIVLIVVFPLLVALDLSGIGSGAAIAPLRLLKSCQIR